MASGKHKQEKARLHPRNKNRERYDLSALTTANPELKTYVMPNKYGTASVDFSNPVAVKLLNKALLNHYYGIKNWEFPDENLCPPIPGRADYIHHIADLLGESNFGREIVPGPPAPEPRARDALQNHGTGKGAAPSRRRGRPTRTRKRKRTRKRCHGRGWKEERNIAPLSTEVD